MFCKNCGKEIAEGKKFCGACGTPVAAPAAAEAPKAETPVMNTPVATIVEEPVAPAPEYYPPAAPVPTERRVGKEKYIWKKAPGGVKSSAVAGTIVGILCIVICVAMFAQFALGSIFDYPIFELADVDLEFEEDTFESEVKQLEMELKRLEAELDNISDSDEKKKAEKLIDYTKDLMVEFECAAETPSIYNFYMMAQLASEIGDDLEDEVEFDRDLMEDAMDVGRNVSLVFGGYGLFILLLTLLAVIFRNNFFTVPALILGVAFPFFFSGIIYGVLFVAGYITLFILNIVVNSSYRKYKKAFKKTVA